MAILSVQSPNFSSGTVVSYGAANGGGDSFPNNGNTHLRVKNAGGSTCNVTAAAQGVDNFSVSGSALNKSWAVAAGEERVLGPFNPARFNDANGRVQISYDQVVSVTVAATAGTV